MDSEPSRESPVGKTVDEWILIDDGGQELYVGMRGERTIAGNSPGFAVAPDGSCEVVIIGPTEADGRRRIGLHREGRHRRPHGGAP